MKRYSTEMVFQFCVGLFSATAFWISLTCHYPNISNQWQRPRTLMGVSEELIQRRTKALLVDESGRGNWDWFSQFGDAPFTKPKGPADSNVVLVPLTLGSENWSPGMVTCCIQPYIWVTLGIGMFHSYTDLTCCITQTLSTFTFKNSSFDLS